MAAIKGFKTITFNLVMTIIAVVAMLSPDAPLPDGEQVTGAIDIAETAFVTIWGVVNLILRAITDSPVFKKK